MASLVHNVPANVIYLTLRRQQPNSHLYPIPPAGTTGIGASVLLADLVYNVPANVIVDSARRALTGYDVFTSMVKSWVFGVVVATVGWFVWPLNCKKWRFSDSSGSVARGLASHSPMLLWIDHRFCAELLLLMQYLRSSSGKEHLFPSPLCLNTDQLCLGLHDIGRGQRSGGVHHQCCGDLVGVHFHRGLCAVLCILPRTRHCTEAAEVACNLTGGKT